MTSAAPVFRWHPEARVVSGALGAREAAAHEVKSGIRYIPDTGGLAELKTSGFERPFFLGEGPPWPDLGAPTAGTFYTATSGSTGHPRMVQRTQASWLRSFTVNADLFGIGPNSVVAILGPLRQSINLYGALEAINLGARLVDLSECRPDRQCERIGSDGVTVIYATPTNLRLILQSGSGATFGAVRILLIGGERLSPEVRERLQPQFPNAHIREFYGSAECSFVAINDETTPVGSVGRPYPSVEIEIRGAGGDVLPRGETGEVWVKSSYLFERYATDPAPHTRWDGAHLTIGEYGSMDGAGHLFLAGRAGRMFTSAGQNIFPESIEAAILSVPGVSNALVLPVADKRRGNRIVAIVHTNDPKLKSEDIRTVCLDRVGRARTPASVLFRPDWPVLQSGKTDIERLRAELKAGTR